MAWAAIVRDVQNDEAFKRALTAPKCGLGETALARIIAAAKHSGLSIHDHITGLDEPKVIAFLAKLATIDQAYREAGLGAAFDHIVNFTEGQPSLREWNAKLKDRGEAAAMNLDLLIQAAQYFESIFEPTENEMARGVLQATPDLIEEFISEAALQSGEKSSTGDDAPYVSLMSIHKSKGLEFDQVFIPACEKRFADETTFFDELLGNAKSGGEHELVDEDTEEERRIFYVALTRARKRLALSWSRTRVIHGEFQKRNPSMFLAEIPQELLYG